MELASPLITALQACPLLGLPSQHGLAVLFGYLFTLALFDRILPGQIVPGVVLEDKTRLYYKCNGFLSLILLSIAFLVGWRRELYSLEVIAEKGGELFVTTLIFSFLESLILYVSGCLSKSKSSSLRPHRTGNFINDWWLGVQLNPSFLGIDVKFFTVKAGMMGWFFINLSIAARQIQIEGFLTLPMILYQSFSMIYVLDFFWFEEYMTSTWDIIAENFGYMLIFGDLVWIPFTFSIQGWWLLTHKPTLTIYAAALNIIIFVIGYAVFRGANRQKHLFKKNPKTLIWGQPPKTIGGKLLASGYWGISRHCNYLGDIILALSLSLPCGASSLVPYFYPLYLFLLLLWRERRDEARCSDKYKELWAEYCKAVPWRIFPYLY
ncbi:hypothetical protein KP509_37G058500 [Ceratopteris richardii]|uniref:Delta(14)-sterol reductase n=1 Tax=Ceratopteris richardii TaxID=49495 RepID=A0A8T2Q9H5_CERRI|nr:hypothetical protein KP509_37G058500 [Ceratopteris richardii]KAH7280269.1 hypothetical protein KP509_37G058500 [Ceratopteris richardii]